MSTKNSNKKKHIHGTEKKAVLDPIITNKKLVLRLSLVLAVLSFLLYSNTLHHGFVLDDSSIISDNPMTKLGTAALKDIFSNGYRAGFVDGDINLYRPLSKAMFAIEWQISPNNPTIHHFVNILLYAISCALLFIVLLKVTKLNIYLLFIAAVIFAAHPIHTEVVANIKSRDELLTLFFLLLSLLFLFKNIETKKIISFIGFLGSFFLALLSKESAIVYIALVPVCIYFFTNVTLKVNLRYTLAALGLAIFYLILHKSIIGNIGISNIPVIDNSLMATTNFMQQRMTAILIMGKYLLLLFFPHPLSCDYSFDTIPIVTSFANFGFLLAFIIHVAMLVFVFKKAKEKNILAFCILFYLISMAIASNIFILIGTHMAERLLFFPSIAFCLAFTYGLCKIFKLEFNTTELKFSNFFSTYKLVFASTAVLVLLFSIKTVARNKDWKTNGTLFDKDIETVPNSAHMLMYVGDHQSNKDSLAALDPEAKKLRLLKAQRNINKALDIYYLFPDAHYLSGRIWYEMQNYDSAYACYNRARALNPGKSMYHNNTGTALFSLGRYEEAMKEFQEAEKISPDQADYSFNLGSAYGTLGEVYKAKNDQANAVKYFNMAIEKFKKAIKLDPQYKSAYQFAGVTFNSLGDTVQGKEYLQKAASIKVKKN